MKSETYPSGRVVTAGYDLAERATTVSGSLSGQGKNYVTSTTYWPHGAVRQMSYGNGLWRDVGYINGRLQPTAYWDVISEDPNKYLRLEYPVRVDANQHNNGTLQGTTIYAGPAAPWMSLPHVTQTFGYDEMNRLKTATETAGWAQTYSYDEFGNMWMPSTNLPVPPLGPAAPPVNVYSASGAGNNRNVNSTYDPAGNLTVFGSVSVSYDAENRQKAAGANSYYYDGAGQRVKKVLSSGTTVYVYDAFGQLAAEYNTAAVTASPCLTCYLSYDYLGGVRLVTDGSANVIARHDYAPFGQEVPAGVGGRTAVWGGNDKVSQKFTGQERDAETNLDYFNARYLSSGLGRFMSVDPGNAGADFTNPQSWNGMGMC